MDSTKEWNRRRKPLDQPVFQECHYKRHKGMAIYGPVPPPETAHQTEHLPTRETATLVGHDGPVLAVRFNSQGTYCLSCGRDRTIKLWNPYKQTLIKTYAGHGHDVRDATVSSDNSQFASCGGDRQAYLWDVSKAAIIRKFRGHDAAINAIVYSGSNEILVTAGYDQTVSVWDCRSRSIDAVQSMRTFRDSVASVRMTSSCNIIAGSIDGSVQRFDVRKGQVFKDDIHIPVSSICVTSDGRSIAASCLDSSIKLLDSAGGDQLGRYEGGHTASSYKIECGFTVEESCIVSASEDGRVCYYDVIDGRPVEQFTAHKGVVCSLAMHPGGTSLLTASTDGCIKLWT